jgi:hypothetical protein
MQLRDARPIAQIAALRWTLDDGAILRRQRGDRPLHIPHRAEILLDARLVFAPELGLHFDGVFLHCVQNALLPIHPGPLAHTE